MLKVVHVQWVDSAFAASEWKQWSDFNDWIKSGAPLSDSVGFLTYEDDKMIVLAQSIGETELSGGLKIIRASIKRIRKISQVDITLKEFG